jgi:hypothetical protein
MIDGIISVIGLVGVIFLFYKFLVFLLNLKNKKLRRVLAVMVFVSLLVVFGLTYYVNHYLPHGQMYETGDIACQYEDRLCNLEYKENLANLNIPEWAKFFKNNTWFVLVFILGLMEIALTTKTEKG